MKIVTVVAVLILSSCCAKELRFYDSSRKETCKPSRCVECIDLNPNKK